MTVEEQLKEQQHKVEVLELKLKIAELEKSIASMSNWNIKPWRDDTPPFNQTPGIFPWGYIPQTIC